MCAGERSDLIPALPLRVYWSCLGAAAALVFSLVPAVAAGQGVTRADSLAYPGIHVPRSWAPRVPWVPPPAFTRFGLAVRRGDASRDIAARERAALEQMLADSRRDLWRASAALARDRGVTSQPAGVALPLLDPMVAQRSDSGLAGLVGNLLADDSPIGMQLSATFLTKVDRTRNERCTASQFFSITAQCSAGFTPDFDLQFDIRAGGSIADRLHINVDYDSKREFKSSDNINIYYQGKSDEWIEKLEVGNVGLQLPPSQFITSGIPSGNYGIQAIGQVGPMKYRAIVAQQQGNVPKSYDVVVGDRTVKPDNRELEDYQIEARRFFFTVDPKLFGVAYPNIDLLNQVQMQALAEALPETARPHRLRVYRLLVGGIPVNPNGPRFDIIGDSKHSGEVYQLLQENKDYYVDRSLLWIALQNQLSQNERLVVAYTLQIAGRDTVIAELGGTPDVQYEPDRPQLAHLLWDRLVLPADPAFQQEIRSVYRVAGEDLRRQSVSLRILTGGGTGQEKPLAGIFDTYLQMFGLAQSGNAALFDIENRLWPRPSDPNVSVGGAANAKIIRDFFLVPPSVRPFARDGLVAPGNPLSDTIYVTPGEDLYSQQHPQSHYRLQFHYDIEGGGNVGTLALGAVQLRRASEVVVVDGVPLVRGEDKDYTIDYEVGMITFTRPDTLFIHPRRVSVRYEENPLFAAAPTSILGFTAQFPMERGEFGFTMISQRQSTAFTRPPLGYEPQSSFIAGVQGHFGFEVSALSRLIEKWPTIRTTTLSHADVQAEFATSRPQPNSAGAAYLQTFEGEGNTPVPLQEAAWHYSSQPALGARLLQRYGDETFSLARAATMAWQGTGLSRANIPIQFTLPQIDPQVTLSGNGVSAPEPMLWLTLYPTSIGGLLSDRTGQFQWKIENAPTGRHWRSLVAGLNASGADLSRVEYLGFWTLADTSLAKRATNPTLIIDLGDPSENSVAFGPNELNLTPGVADSAYRGKTLLGFDILNSERDSLSRSFNQSVNDNGLPGDVVPLLNVFNGDNFVGTLENFATCSRGAYQVLLLGDARNNCTVKNGRLDEEDVDFDNVLNLSSAQREQERIRRYIVDLSNPASYTRIGNCNIAAFDTAAGGTVTATDLCWVRVQVPFRTPDDSLNGGPNIRRIRAMRLTVLSGEGTSDTALTQLPIALFKFEGSPYVKRAEHTVSGIAGDVSSQGFVISSVIGTQDRDSLRNVDYESPPGVTDETEKQQTGLESVKTQINEHSLRLLAGNLAPFERAESFERFPEGIRNFMSYKELRVWARGRGNGWGQNAELQFYIKIGRDANNFYLYRTSISSGPGRAAWQPEIRVDFNRLFALQAQMRSSIFQAGADSLACTGIDSVLIARSGVPVGQPINRHAACADGYMVYSVDPAVNPPSLAQVQELAVGMVRVADGAGPTPITLSDTLELWVDDIRLGNVEDTPGYAGNFSLNVQAGDVANFRASVSRRDPYFRQLAESPSFLGNDGVDFATSVRLERLLPGASAYSLPLTISHTEGASQPLFLSQSDILAAGVTGLRTPQSSVTRYGMTMRRATPMVGTPLAVVVNNLTANANYTRADSRSEFSDGGSRNWNVGVDYNLNTPNARFTSLRFLGGGARTKFRWNPTQLRLSTDLLHAADNRLSFSKPVAVAGDSGRRVTGLNHVLRTSSAIEFRPVPSVTAGWSFSAVRDLRDYGDTSATAIIASKERERLLGVNFGLERERQMNTAIRFEPAFAAYFHPTVSFITSYSMLRDPQARQLVRTGDSTGAFALPRRVTNFQTLAATSYFDPSRAFKKWLGDEGRRERIFDRFQAIDLAYSRSLTSSFDGAPFDPGLAYQFALGGIDRFLETEDHRASIAGAADLFTLSTGLRLRRDLDLTTRMQFQNTDNYTRRLDNTQALIQGHQQTLPSIGIRWSDSLPWIKNWQPFGKDKGKPFRWLRVLSTLGVNASVENTRNVTLAPGESEDAPDDRRVFFTQHVRGQTSVNWRDPGSLLTNFSFDQTHRTDSVPGSITETRAKEMSVDVSRAFRIPESWIKLPGRVRTHVSWVRSTASSYISVQNSTKPSRLADNGRTIISLNGETDVMPRVKFSLSGSRVITFDNNYNRKLSQYVLSTVFQLQYDIGNIGNMR